VNGRRAAACAAARIAVALTVGLAGPATGADQWFLLGRHGGCFDIETLKRRLPDLPGLTDPDAFIRFVQSKGLQFTRQTHPVPSGKAVEIVVPDRELSLVFVTAELCRAAESRPK
jgi:hypothetical protein